MLWGDTFVHSVKNLTNQRRIVVYMDVIRKTGKSNLDWLIRNMMNIAMNSNSVKEYIRSTETKQKLRS
jgi:aspartyl/asparaginyl beta-hydroxylase (cupin superfamily)